VSYLEVLTRTHLEGLNKSMKTITISSTLAEISVGNLRNTSPTIYRYTSLFSANEILDVNVPYRRELRNTASVLNFTDTLVF
jgi:hypothetical protein